MCPLLKLNCRTRNSILYIQIIIVSIFAKNESKWFFFLYKSRGYFHESIDVILFHYHRHSTINIAFIHMSKTAIFIRKIARLLMGHSLFCYVCIGSIIRNIASGWWNHSSPKNIGVHTRYNVNLFLFPLY